ncbi:hypothetical protein [Persicimonas caeni]|nr:hypothetical protein [Persicimonas caeni]
MSLVEYGAYLRRLRRSAGEKVGAGTALFSAFFVLGVGLVLTGVLVSELM